MCDHQTDADELRRVRRRIHRGAASSDDLAALDAVIERLAADSTEPRPLGATGALRA